MAQSLKNNRKFAFRSFGSEEPTTLELRRELENLHKFIQSQFGDLTNKLEDRFNTHTDILTVNGELVFADGSVIIITGVPN